MKLTCIVLILSVVVFGHAADHDNSPERLAQAIPHFLHMLFQWPSNAETGGEARVDSKSQTVMFPGADARRWIKSVLSPEWQPDDAAEMLFLRDEFDDVDTARIRWRHEGYDIQVSQTASTMVIQVTPVAAGDAGEDTQERISTAREISNAIFAENGSIYRLTIEGEQRIPVPGVRAAILSSSFDSDEIKTLPGDGSVWHVPSRLANTVRNDRSDRGLADSDEMRGFWFRNMYWWNDGRSVGFYFVKVEGVVSWVPNFSGQRDTHWFD